MVATKSRSRTKNAVRASLNGTQGKSNQNGILLALPRTERDWISEKVEWVDLPLHSVLHEAGRPIQFGYFVNGGLVSILNVMSNGKTVEVGLTGKEGFVGTPLLVGFSTSPTRVVMQVAGSGFRIRARDVQGALRGCANLERSLLRYMQELTLQATQVAACNRLHEVEERLARWLLMSQDRLGGDDVPLTQQFLAHMLGTRRASVTVAAGILQKAGLITYNRGKVKIKNRRDLRDASCECYEKMNRQSRRWQTESKSASNSRP
jgi:CRP-like cAMP-binding protein